MKFEELNSIEIKNYKNFIYFLIKDGIVIYVGQTSHGFLRIQQHQRNKEFDNFKILLCDKEKLLELEEKYILKYQPKLNKNINWINYVDIARLRTKIRKKHNVSSKKIYDYIKKNNITITKFKNRFLVSKEMSKEIEDYFERGD